MSTSEEEEDNTEQEEEKEKNSEFSEEEILIKNFNRATLFPSNILLFLVFLPKMNSFTKIYCGIFIFFLWSTSGVNNDWRRPTIFKLYSHK